MNTPDNPGIWFKADSARESDVNHVTQAAERLGGMSVRVVTSPIEAQVIAYDINLARLEASYPDEDQSAKNKLAAHYAARFVDSMTPSSANSYDPSVFIWVEGVGGQQPNIGKLGQEIKFRSRS